MDYDAYDAILHHIFKQTQGDAWFKPAEENISTGVCVRIQPGLFRLFPYENLALEPFELAVRALNPEVAVKMRSAAVHASLARVGPDTTSFALDAKNRIQVLGTMSELAGAEKGQCAAFIRDERVLVVWTDSLDDIIPIVNDLEERLLKLAWKGRAGALSRSASRAASIRASPSHQSLHGPPGELPGKGGEVAVVKDLEVTVIPNEKRPTSESNSTDGDSAKDVEAAFGPSPPRPIRLFAPTYIGLAMALAIFFIGSGVDILVQEWVQDKDYTHFALLATTPLVFCVSLFFALQLINTLSYLIGPVAQYHENSKYYSAVAPRPVKLDHLPHITVQMPVFSESLAATITPSIMSVKRAMLTYARQGGTSSIFVNDDGLQLLDEPNRLARIEFYTTHDIGWVARPPHSAETPRAGRFKKASNMNYGLAMSLRMEEILMEFQADPTKVPLSILAADEEGKINGNETRHLPPPPNPFTTSTPGGSTPVSGSAFNLPSEDNTPEQELAEKALAKAVQDNSRGKAWAGGGKWMRMGEIILLVDSDAQVPQDCFLDAARELAECPDVAIIQHESDVMQVAHHYFENAIAYFTRRINRCISMACANGEVAPFVGHNAFLRWQAIQDAAFLDKNGIRKFWSESNVSEDFDLALRLILKGYTVRWATYSKGGFKEGVSLTCDDELNRWQKYTYGCNELIFNPLYKWLFKGPITSRLHRFLWSSAPLHYKISMMSYMFSYYGIAAAMFLSVLNYFLLGWTLPVDGYFFHSWEIWLACTVVFPGAGNIGMTVLEYRLGMNTLLWGLLEHLKWIPFFFFFFGGLSLHLSGAILAHLFSYNMTWTATKKEVEHSNFFREVPKILKRFGLSWSICWILLIAMILLSTSVVPEPWQVTAAGWAVIFPLAVQVGCHILYPIVLNPWLMIFSY